MMRQAGTAAVAIWADATGPHLFSTGRTSLANSRIEASAFASGIPPIGTSCSARNPPATLGDPHTPAKPDRGFPAPPPATAHSPTRPAPPNAPVPTSSHTRRNPSQSRSACSSVRNVPDCCQRSWPYGAPIIPLPPPTSPRRRTDRRSPPALPRRRCIAHTARGSARSRAGAPATADRRTSASAPSAVRPPRSNSSLEATA